MKAFVCFIVLFHDIGELQKGKTTVPEIMEKRSEELENELRQAEEEEPLWFTVILVAVVAALIICFFVLWYRSYRR